MRPDPVQALTARRPWVAGPVPGDVPHGDMPGDRVRITPAHTAVAATLFPLVADALVPVLRHSPSARAVVAVAGGSGVGKSEVASVLAFHLRSAGVGTYTLSGDNYPRRYPAHNDAERLRVFRAGGVVGLVDSGEYTAERAGELRRLMAAGADADPGATASAPWLAVYQERGRAALRAYLGTPAEIDFEELSGVVERFRDGEATIWLKRMGRTDADLWYDAVDLAPVSVLVIEWTHGLSDHLRGVDVPVLLHSTPAETLAHRRARNRDGAPDSPFTTMVLEIEQDLLARLAPRAAVVLGRNGESLPQVRRRAPGPADGGDDA